MYLIDTSVILPCLWKTTKQSYLKLLEDLSEDEAPAISVITRFEVLAGTVEDFLEANKRFLDGFRQIDVTQEVADRAGRLFFEWSRKGQTLSANDLLIGASVITHGLVLATKNAKHFPYLSKVDQYVIEYQSRKKRKVEEPIHILRIADS
jgi:predicted nucleic acid-binding protein